MEAQNSFNYQQSVNIAVVTVICGIFTSLISEFIRNVFLLSMPYLRRFQIWLSQKIFGKKNALTMKSYIHSNDVYRITFERFIITEVAKKIKLTGNIVECVVKATGLYQLPLNYIEHDDIVYEYEEEIASDSLIKQGITRITRLYIESYKYGNDELINFIEKFKKDYYRIFNNKIVAYVDSIDKESINYGVFRTSHSGGINNIYNAEFREIFKIYLDKYMKEEIPRINILLYGPPGTGKTTIIKRIASEIDAVIYSVKLSQFNTIDKLRNFMFSKINPGIDHRDEFYATVKPDMSINIFEDFDADIIDVLNKRETVKKNTSNDDNNVDKKKPIKAVEWRLDDILNLLDGVLPLDRVINIFTTNCLDRIDPAFYRPGRMDICMEISGLSYREALNYIDDNAPWEICKLGLERLKKWCPIRISCLQEEISRAKTSHDFLNNYVRDDDAM